MKLPIFATLAVPGATAIYYIPNGNIADHGQLTSGTNTIADYFK